MTEENTVLTYHEDEHGVFGSEESRSSMFADLANAQKELDTAKKDSAGFNYNYSDLASVIKTIKPIHEHGLSVSQQILEQTKDYVRIRTLLMHKSGAYLSSIGSITIPDGKNKTQDAGSAQSYLRRYAIQAIVGLASEDNDAAKKVSGEVKKQESKPVRKPFRKSQGGNDSGGL